MPYAFFLVLMRGLITLAYLVLSHHIMKSYNILSYDFRLCFILKHCSNTMILVACIAMVTLIAGIRGDPPSELNRRKSYK